MEDNSKEVTIGGKKPQEKSVEDMSREIAMKAAQEEVSAPQAQPSATKTITPSKGDDLASVPEGFIDDEFAVITDTVVLPSEGLFYENGQKTVKVKYLTAEDENILTSPDLIRSGKVLDVLLKSSIIDDNLTPGYMVTGDRNAVLLALRSTGYGDDYEVKMTCDSCGETYETEVQLSKLRKKSMPVKPDDKGEFYVKLPKMKVPVMFRLLRGDDESRLSKVAEVGKKRIDKNTSVSTVLTERYLLQIMEANGNRDKAYIKKMISAMPIADSLFLREYIREAEPGVDMDYVFECTSCGASKEENIPITPKLFWPNANI